MYTDMAYMLKMFLKCFKCVTTVSLSRLQQLRNDEADEHEQRVYDHHCTLRYI